jgi:hypothetical protein
MHGEDLSFLVLVQVASSFCTAAGRVIAKFRAIIWGMLKISFCSFPSAHSFPGQSPMPGIILHRR